MLNSEKMGWFYFISWDNPIPPNSKDLVRNLRKLGRVTILNTKTSVVLAPYKDTDPSDVREAIKENIHKEKGTAFYVNLRTSKGFHYGRKTGYEWKRAPSIPK